ncbi:hypothetical protein BGLT_03455 [Caballeronia glathei]|nr:hypothetical protein BGLT_03455 [Caballeronia glathei]
MQPITRLRAQVPPPDPTTSASAFAARPKHRA